MGLNKTRRIGRVTIPKIIIQTAKEPIEPRIVNRLKKQARGYEYKFFNDDDIMAFFKENPDLKYPRIAEVFYSFTKGEHRADLFRYYYLYKKGGVYIDSDLMIYDPIEQIIGKNTFVSVWDIRHKGAAFNGFIGAIAGHPIIAAALKKLYTTPDRRLLKDYFSACKDLGRIISAFKGPIKMLIEVSIISDKACRIMDSDTGRISLIHYYGVRIPVIDKN